MRLEITLVLWVFALYLFFKASRWVLKRQSNLSKAAQLGCQPAPSYPRPWWDPLGLTLLSELNNAANEKTLIESIHESFNVMSQDQGRAVTSFTYRLLGSPRYFTMDPRNFQAILATQFNDFNIGDDRIEIFMPLLGPGIFNSNGQQWAHQRGLLRPCFTRDQINDLELHEAHLSNLLARLPAKADGWTGEVDLQPLFFNYTLDNSTSFLFGESANVQLHDSSTLSSKGKAFGDAFNAGNDALAARSRLGDLFWLYNPPSFRKNCRICHDFIDEYVRIALSKPIHEAEKVSGKKQKYILLDELVKVTRDPLEIRANLMNILLAGRDTTASLLGFFFARLARHPEVFKRLRREVVSVFGDAFNPGQELGFASLKNCSYLQYCLNEALRLYPVVPFNGRVAVKDTTLPRGGGHDGESPLYIPKGTFVDYFVFGAHRNPKYWGDDALEFKPERWAGRKNGFEFIPFNAGRHSWD